MTIAAPTTQGPVVVFDYGLMRGSFLRQRTSMAENDVRPIAVPTAPPVDLEDLKRQAAIDWAMDVIEPLRSLRANWDSYGAAPLNSTVATTGVRVLAGLAIGRIAPPQAFPTADGGLSLEWHRPDLDFVISISPPDEDPPTAYFRTAAEQWVVGDIFRVIDPRIGAALSALAEG